MGQLSISALALGAMLVALPSAASAQVVQVIDFPAAQITGAWAAGGCGTGNERGSSTIGQSMTLTWTDTTGAPNSTVVEIEVQANWKFWCANGGYTVDINGTDMGAGATPNNTNNCLCNASPFNTSSQILGPGTFNWNSGGSNTLSFTISATSWIGIMDNSQNPNWSARLTVTLLNQAPGDPVNLGQIGADGKGIGVGGVSAGGTVTLRATVSDPDFDDCYLEAEVHPPTVFFPGTPNYVGAATASGTFATIDLAGLPEGPYHWQVRSVDEFDVRSPWVPFGSNSEIVADFIIDSSFAPPKPIDGENHGGGDCSISAGAAAGALFSALFGAAMVAAGLLRRRS